MRVVSHYTLALYASVRLGLQPQLPSAFPHSLHSSVVWTQSFRSKHKRGCLIPSSAYPALHTAGSRVGG